MDRAFKKPSAVYISMVTWCKKIAVAEYVSVLDQVSKLL